MPAEAKLEIVLSRKPGDMATPRKSSLYPDSGMGPAGATGIRGPEIARPVTDRQTGIREVLKEIHERHLEQIKAIVSGDAFKPRIEPAQQLITSPKTEPLPRINTSQAIVQQQQQARAKLGQPEPMARYNSPTVQAGAGNDRIGELIAMLKRQQVDFIQQIKGTTAKFQSEVAELGKPSQSPQMAQLAKGSGKTSLALSLGKIATSAGLAGASLAGLGGAAVMMASNIKRMAGETRQFSPELIHNEVEFDQLDIARKQNNARDFGSVLAKGEKFINRVERSFTYAIDTVVLGWANMAAKLEEFIEGFDDNGKEQKDAMAQMANELRKRGKTEDQIQAILDQIREDQGRKEIEAKAGPVLKMLDDMMKPMDSSIMASRRPVQDRVAPEIGMIPRVNQ